MKLRPLFIFVTLAFLLAACNFSLAADVTPPPNYVEPTPMPTLGPLYPAQSMDIFNGAKIYMEKCVDCHGVTGLGDGEKGKQLPVKVAPIGLADVAGNAKPSAWYTQVTRGNIERFMPPFASLNDQERWDVVGYAMFMHMTPEQVDQGKALFQANCADCEKYFTDLKTMAELSEADLIAIAKNGKDAIPAFGKNLSDEELAVVAIYLRSLSFAGLATHGSGSAPEATATLEVAAAPSVDSTPIAESTPADGTQIAPTESIATTEPVAGVGSVSGAVDNQTGAALPAGAKVLLHGYEHGSDSTAAPEEVVNMTGALNADGTYLFEGVDIPASRIFVAEVEVDGMTYASEFMVVAEGMTAVELPAIIAYESTDDFSVLKISNMQIFFDYPVEGDPQMFAIYTIVNDSGKTVRVKMDADQTDVPFLASAVGAQPMGIEATQDSAAFAETTDGFAMPPSETPYGLVAFSSMTRGEEIKISQPMLLAADEVSLFLPEGVEAQGKTLTDGGVQAMQGMNFHIYTAGKFAKDGVIEFTLTGEPSVAAAVPAEGQKNNNLLIGIGAFGAALIALGGWLFIRDRKKAQDEDETDDDEDEDDSDVEDVMDAIIALDDLHRSGKISDEAYKTRRGELKNKLKKS